MYLSVKCYLWKHRWQCELASYQYNWDHFPNSLFLYCLVELLTDSLLYFQGFSPGFLPLNNKHFLIPVAWRALEIPPLVPKLFDVIFWSTEEHNIHLVCISLHSSIMPSKMINTYTWLWTIWQVCIGQDWMVR